MSVMLANPLQERDAPDLHPLHYEDIPFAVEAGPVRANELTGGEVTPVQQPALPIVAPSRTEMADQSVVCIE